MLLALAFFLFCFMLSKSYKQADQTIVRVRYIYLLILLVIINIILISGCVKQGYSGTMTEQELVLPMSSILELSGDSTSSGASRLYNASLVFQKGQIASGWQRYEAWPSSPSYPSTIYECIIDINSSSWRKRETGGECKMEAQNPNLPSIPLTKSEVELMIISEKIKPIDICSHFEICYSIKSMPE